MDSTVSLGLSCVIYISIYVSLYIFLGPSVQRKTSKQLIVEVLYLDLEDLKNALYLDLKDLKQRGLYLDLKDLKQRGLYLDLKDLKQIGVIFRSKRP